MTTGFLAERSILLPFYTFSGVMLVTLVVGVLVGGSRLQGRPAEAAPGVAVTAAGP